MPASETSLVYTVSSRLCGEKLLKREIEKKFKKRKKREIGEREKKEMKDKKGIVYLKEIMF